MKQIVLDYETRSEANLKKVGGIEYSKHPTTEILCLGYKIDDTPAELWVPGQKAFPLMLRNGFRNKEVTLIAHNALFEQAITENVLRKDITTIPHLPPSRWKCTAAKAAACALPRNLENACLALNLPIKKDMHGRKLMLKYSKPRQAWNKWNVNPIDEAPQKYFDQEIEVYGIQQYCKTDVEAEYLLDKALPDLIPLEQEIWLLNQAMNFRGIRVDVETTKQILELIAHQTEILEGELLEITGLRTVNQRDKLLDFLRNNGLPHLTGLAAKDVKETLESLDEVGLVGSQVERVLQIRQTLSKSSTKKYRAILERAGDDERVRDLALYHGASTGRESGTGLQIQNLPRGNVKDTDQAIEAIKLGDHEFLGMLYGDTMQLYASCIRGMIRASPNHHLFVADYNAIEARVLAWIASDDEALGAFIRNEDPYKKMASGIFHKDILQISESERFIGKIAELALGYGMGAAKFFKTCMDWGAKDVTQELADVAVKTYRNTHAPIVALWSKVERAAMTAVQKPHQIIRIGKVAFGMQGKFLWCELPSGRKIRYYDPDVRNKAMPWGEMRRSLFHWSVNSMTKKWECASTYGALLVENIVQATARDLTLQAALRCERKGYTYLFQVHDELVSESKSGSVEEFENLLVDNPKWALDLPVVAKGWTGLRYKK